MKKALITGINGFVGPYLKKELEENGYKVFGIDKNAKGKERCDLLDKFSLQKILSEIKPTIIFHLAAFSNPLESYKNKEICYKINIEGTKNLLELSLKNKAKVLIVSSATVYGAPDYIPIDEFHSLYPQSPYDKSRVDQEKLALQYPNTFIARAFNHTGKNQPSKYVIPSFCKQIKEAKEGDTILVGNLDVIRDFSRVEDVVNAYRLIVEKGNLGQIYNVGRGRGYRLKYILNKMIEHSGKSLKIKVDPEKFREADVTGLICDNSKIRLLGADFRNFLDYL